MIVWFLSTSTVPNSSSSLSIFSGWYRYQCNGYSHLRSGDHINWCTVFSNTWISCGEIRTPATSGSWSGWRWYCPLPRQLSHQQNLPFRWWWFRLPAPSYWAVSPRNIGTVVPARWKRGKYLGAKVGQLGCLFKTIICSTGTAFYNPRIIIMRPSMSVHISQTVALDSSRNPVKQNNHCHPFQVVHFSLALRWDITFG